MKMAFFINIISNMLIETIGSRQPELLESERLGSPRNTIAENPGRIYRKYTLAIVGDRVRFHACLTRMGKPRLLYL